MSPLPPPSPADQTFWQTHLDPGERLLWAGHPAPGIFGLPGAWNANRLIFEAGFVWFLANLSLGIVAEIRGLAPELAVIGGLIIAIGAFIWRLRSLREASALASKSPCRGRTHKVSYALSDLQPLIALPRESDRPRKMALKSARRMTHLVTGNPGTIYFERRSPLARLDAALSSSRRNLSIRASHSRWGAPWEAPRFKFIAIPHSDEVFSLASAAREATG